MTKNIFKSNGLISAFMLLALVLNSLAVALSPVSVLAEPTNPDTPTPDLSDSPKIKLIQKNYNYNFSAKRWEIDNTKSTTSYQEKNCSDLYSQGIKGIADYEDGISKNTYANYPTETRAQVKSLYNSKNRACAYFNEMAENYMPCDYTRNAVETYASYQMNKAAVCSAPIKENFTPANNPVYSYHLQYKYDFPVNQKTQLSNSYRSLTGLEGDYDGVVWAYTYYTYKDTQTNQYKTWANPNVDNNNSGWLMYGMLPVVSTTIKNSLNQDYTLTYDPTARKLRFKGKVVVGNSGCWSLGTNHAFIVKPYSDGTYNSFKLFYESKNSGSEICTSNIPAEDLDYIQDMSDLSSAGQQFLINYISQNRFKESDVEKYTGIMPVG
jgi:hypothetical protein